MIQNHQILLNLNNFHLLLHQLLLHLLQMLYWQNRNHHLYLLLHYLVVGLLAEYFQQILHQVLH